MRKSRYSSSVVSIGDVFGRLTIMESVRHKVWRVKCSGRCNGTLIDIWESRLLNNTLSCGCEKIKTGSDNHSWSGVGGLSGRYYGRIRQGALKRNIEFNVDMVYLWNLFQKQQGKCALTGEEISLPRLDRNVSSKLASLDRIESSKGYVKGNLQWVNRDINTMKMDFSQSYFIKMCKAVANHNVSNT